MGVACFKGAACKKFISNNNKMAPVCHSLDIKNAYTMVWVNTRFWLAAGCPLKSDRGHLVK